VIKCSGPLHLDQGVAVRSHASQGKTVDQVIASVPVAAFSQTNKAQFYVSMSRARHAMHLYTDSKAALKEAVMRPSERLCPMELLLQGDTSNRIRRNHPTQGIERTPEFEDRVPRCRLAYVLEQTLR